MPKKSLERKIDALTHIVEKGFAAIAEDVANLATKDQVITLHGQANSIEVEIRSMKQAKLESRVGDLEDAVFGTSKARAARQLQTPTSNSNLATTTAQAQDEDHFTSRFFTSLFAQITRWLAAENGIGDSMSATSIRFA
jgi:hypothetical protein